MFIDNNTLSTIEKNQDGSATLKLYNKKRIVFEKTYRSYTIAKQQEGKHIKEMEKAACIVTIPERCLIAFNEAKSRLFAGQKMHVHFSDGNTKTHIPSIDLLPHVTCHGRCRELCGKVAPGKKCAPCYADKIVSRFPDAMRNYAENTVLAIYRPDQYWQEVREKMFTCGFMRLFVSGDMIIAGYFENLCNALLDNPHCEIQGFTKCYEIVNRYIKENGNLPENLHLLFSGWYEYKAINPYNLPESRVYDYELPEGWLSCGGNCSSCACVGLGCWKAAAGDVVGLKRH